MAKPGVRFQFYCDIGEVQFTSVHEVPQQLVTSAGMAAQSAAYVDLFTQVVSLVLKDREQAVATHRAPSATIVACLRRKFYRAPCPGCKGWTIR